MDKRRMYQILDVLTLPYCNPDFYHRNQDCIASVREAFYEVSNRNNLGWKKAEQLKKHYHDAENEVKRFVGKQLYVTQIDDYILMLNLFFKEQECNKLFGFFREIDNREYLISVLYLKNLSRIARSLLTFRDGRIAIRMWTNKKDSTGEKDIFSGQDVYNKIEIWNLLSRMMPLDILIAVFLTENELDEEYYLYRQNGMIFLGDNILETLLRRGIAETHLHFNAGMQYQYIWQEYMNLFRWQEINSLNIPFHIIAFRTIFAEYLEHQEGYRCLREFLNGNFSKVLEISGLFDELARGDTSLNSEYTETSYSELYRRWKNVELQDHNFLMGTLYARYKSLHTYEEMIFLFKSAKYFRDKKINAEYVFELRLFMQYLRSKNFVFKDILQSVPIYGLEYFQMHYSTMRRNERAIRLEKHEICKILLHSIHQNVFLKKYEIRVGIPELGVKVKTEYNKQELKRKILREIYLVLKEYKKILEEYQEEQVPNLGIIFSFFKTDSVDNRIGDMCWLQYSETGTKSWNMDHITLKQKRMKDSAVALEELRGEIDFLDKYVVGIDTASVENKAEPWIFAPVYLAIRRQIITKPIRQEKNRYSRINNIGLTYHVGEEFRHILSGFRHIYETISFMGFKAGDRIGHGIALGEDIERWVDRHETIVIPIEEWLENLVWLWGTSISGELNVNIFAEQLKEKIQILASEIYGDDTNLTPDILYEAYLEKFHLLHEKSFEMMKQYCQRDMLEEDGEHFCKYYKGRSNEEHRWTTEKLVCAYFCPVYYRRMQQPIMVHVERENLSLYLKIQEELLRIVAQKGIFVEVNPTSNTAIGENRELFMHHIMNLNNHGLVNEHAHEVMVTINSDDPLIFSTNCENELGYMYHALLSKGYSRERVIEWIDKIRQYGVDSSFVREIRPRNTLLNEIGQILQQIEKIVGVD